LRRIAVLVAIAESDPEAQARVRTFRDTLQDLGWSDGRNIRTDYYFAGGDIRKADRYAAEIVAQPVDIIVANSSLAEP
jgi:putative ABC transport system substrate-binding protein